jgi:hypothetical protein
MPPSSLPPEILMPLSAYLKSNWRSPEQYIFDVFKDHSIILLAEDRNLCQLADGYIYDRPFEKFEGCTIDPDFYNERNWPDIQAQIPDPDWRPIQATLNKYLAQIRAYANLRQRYLTLFT